MGNEGEIAVTKGGVDVVVVAYNSRQSLRACVEPLTRVPWVDVTVVDNASPDDSVATIEDLAARVIRAPRNGGFAYGCNIGIRAGSADFVLLLNPDARIEPEGLAVLLQALRRDTVLAAVGPRIVDDDGTLVYTQRRFPRLRSTYSQALFLHRIVPGAAWSDEVVRDRAAYQRPGKPAWISGCCVLLRREAVESVGGLDERFFLYSEETDLFRRLADVGWRVGFEPRARAWHEGHGSASKNATAPIMAVSRVRYARKHHGRMVAALEGAGTALGALLHAFVWLQDPERARSHLVAARAAARAARPLRAL